MKLNSLLEQWVFFMQRARASKLRGTRIEAIKKAGTTRRMMARRVIGRAA